MISTATVPPIVKKRHVSATPARAFAIFTAGMGRWWLKDHSILKDGVDRADVVMEPRVGGRWFERGVDGSECDWGRVLAWEPPHRVVLAWQLGTDFRYDPDLLTELELRFVEAGQGGTDVTMEHRFIERMGEGAVDHGAMMDRGWGSLLDAFVALVGGEAP